MAPPKRVQPGFIPFWMFNDAATIAQRIQYMRACRKGGIKALAMHSRAGNLLPYGSAEWFETARTLVHEAARLGMNLWLYDEDPFPSGAAGGMVMAEQPELTATAMAWHEKPERLKAGDLWFIGNNRVIWAGLLSTERPGRAREITMPAGSIRNDWAGAPWDSRYYYFDTPVFPCERGTAENMRYAMRVPQIPKGFKLAAVTAEHPGEDGSWNGLPDLLNPAAFHAFERLSIGLYKQYVGRYFGTTIPGIFTDEAKPNGYMPITRDMFASFKRRYGYDLRPRLHQLFGEPLSEEQVKTRLDYRRWVADRFLEAFVRPYRRWCDKNNLLLVGHFSPEDDPIWETACLGAVQPIMRTMSLPGTDIIVPLPGNGAAPCLNLGSLRVGSIRSQNNTRYGVSESWGCTGWSVTSEESRRTIAWQRVLGVNRFFPHGFFNSAEGISLVEAPPDFGPNSAIFPGVCEINKWFEECEKIADRENEFAPVAIVDSLLSYWDWAPGPALPRHEAMRRNLWNTVLACLQAHVGVHMLDEGALAAARVVGSRLAVGKRDYRWIIVPDCERLSLAAHSKLAQAWKAGLPVWWFGGGPKTLVDERYSLRKAGAPPGGCLNGPAPSREWCCRHLPALAHIEGKGSEDVYLRRFLAPGGQFLMAANLADKPLQLALLPEGAMGWSKIQADGDFEPGVSGAHWRAAGRGFGLFKLAALPKRNMDAPKNKPSELNAGRVFQRLAQNVLRLDKPLASWGAAKPTPLPYPKPYWSLTNEYSATRCLVRFLGAMPVESRMPEKAGLNYRFIFKTNAQMRGLTLSMDPRFARGRFAILLDRRALGGLREWPIMRIEPERLRLPTLARGRHTIDFRFEPGSAMDGLLTWAYLEGEFDVQTLAPVPVLAAPARRDSQQGWQAAGMPHYMGLGRYTWKLTLSKEDAARFREIEFERIVDSAELSLNKRALGRRAWSPWRWVLRGLKPGVNFFELTVSGTAANKFSLEWPNKPQGWLGKAWLH